MTNNTICGIVAEYDIFHNGHKYQIEQLKEKTNSNIVIAVMSGNFLQRGIPASFDKWMRAENAINNGIDIVFELPTCYATASAEFFSMGAIGILNKLNSINYISFGCKYDNLDLMKTIAKILQNEDEPFKKELQKQIHSGISFPVARCNALKNYLKDYDNAELIENILLDPNNILAIEYLKALYEYDSNITPYIIKRKSVDYSSTDIVDNITSSTGIRELLKNDDYTNLKKVVSDYTYTKIKKDISSGKMPMTFKNFEKEIFYKLRIMSANEISNIFDVSEGIENTIKKALNNSQDIYELIENIKSKRYTQTRVQRILIHSLLDIKEEYIKKIKYLPKYARLIAVSKNGQKVLPTITKNSSIPIVTSVSKFLKTANDDEKEMMNLDILASNVYTLGYEIPYFKKYNLDFTKPIIKES